MRDLIDGQLTYAARRALEEAVVAAMVAGAGATQAKGADTLATAMLKLLTTLRTADVEPTAALLNPADYEMLRSAVTAQYTAGPPITVDESGQERLFSIPLIVSPSIPDDTAVIANLQSVGVWLRGLQVYVSESHGSYFTLNLVAILAELRAALGVLAPAGVGTVTGWDLAMLPSIEMLERFHAGSYRERAEVVEHKPVRERVAAEDITRVDGLGRTVVTVPAGTVPPSWVALTAAEQASLVEPPPPLRQGHMHPGPYGFSPEGVVVSGFTIEPS